MPPSSSSSGSSSPSNHRILITGSSGFAGRWAVHSLREYGYYVIGGDILPLSPTKQYDLEPLLPPNEFIKLDITNRENVQQAVRQCTTVFHFAALVPYNLSQVYGRQECLRVNGGGTEILVQEAIKAGVKNFILCSSTGVVFKGDAIANGTEVLPTEGPYNDPYSESKAISEKIVLSYNNVQKMACVAIRPNGIMGPGEAHHTPKLLKTARLGCSLFLATGSTSCTDFTSRKNLFHAFHFVLNKLVNPKTRSSVAGQAYFVTDGWPVHTLEFFSPVLEELGFIPPFPSVVVPKGTHGYTKNQRISRSELNQIKQEMELAQRKLGTNEDTSNDVNVTGRQRTGSRGSMVSPSGTLKKANTLTVPVSSSSSVYKDMIILTGPAYIPIPGIFLYPIAYLSEWISFLCRPIVNFEPFLTAADVRKVTRNNYYSTDKAIQELGYEPVENPATMLHDMALFLQKQGYNGRVQSPGLLPWCVAPTGVAFTGILGYNYGSILTTGIESIKTIVPGLPPLLNNYSGFYTSVLSYLGSIYYPLTDSNEFVNSTTNTVHEKWELAILQETILVIFWSALFCHFLQGCLVAYHGWKRNMDSGRWFIQSFLLGYPSTRMFWQVANIPNSDLVQPLGLLLFNFCIPLIIGVRLYLAYGF